MAFALSLVLTGLILEGPSRILSGLYQIITTQDQLITDYFEIAGPGAALVNAGLVTMISLLIVKYTDEAYNGFTIVEVGLMSGFSLFGKNIANIWPIFFGTWLYAKYQKEPFGKHAGVALLSSALGPLVSYMALGSRHASLLLGALTGILIGFLLPALSAYTYKIQNGMNLYNMGFACGLLALVIVPVAAAVGQTPTPALYWSTEYYKPLMGFSLVLCGALLAAGWAIGGKEGWKQYRQLLKTTGRAPADYYQWFGLSAVLLNMGVNGFLTLGYIWLARADLNGPVMGGFFAILGFSAFGKHARNVSPVMLGVALGGLIQQSLASPSIQLAGLFGTTLAPIAGHFGPVFGVLAGFIHSALVLQTGGPVAGLNLYNNGFSGGLIAIVLYPTLTAIVRHRRPKLRDADYYDLFEGDTPINMSYWHTHRPAAEEKHGEEPEAGPRQED